MPGKGIGFNPLKNKILDTKKAFSESVDVTDIKNFVGSDSLKNLDLNKTELLTNDLASTMINTKPMNFKHSAAIKNKVNSLKSHMDQDIVPVVSDGIEAAKSSAFKTFENFKNKSSSSVEDKITSVTADDGFTPANLLKSGDAVATEQSATADDGFVNDQEKTTHDEESEEEMNERLYEGSGVDYKFKNVVPNPVHEYEHYTYDITLAIADLKLTKKWLDAEATTKAGSLKTKEPDTDLSKISESDPNSFDSSWFNYGKDEQTTFIVLAKSGQTNTQVTNLSMKSIIGPTQETGMGNTTNFNFEITQPLGASFVKDLYKASKILGIEEYKVHPFFIQVYLKGRKQDGSIGDDVEIPGTRRVYAMMINNITYSVNSGGSVYSVQGVRAGDLGLADDHQLVQDIEISDIVTFEDFRKGFEVALNKQEQHHLGVTKYILDQYEVEVECENPSETKDIKSSPIISDLEMISNVDLKNQKLRSVSNYDASIKEIITKHVSRTEFFQKKLKGFKEKVIDATAGDEDAKKKWDDIDMTKKLIIIKPYAVPFQWDPLRQDYARKLKYVIRIKNVMTKLAIKEELLAPKEYNQKRVKTMEERKVLTKHYKYHFTGENLDVLNFDIQYNFQYVYPYDSLQGLYNKYPSHFRLSKEDREFINTRNKLKETMDNSATKWNASTKDGKVDRAEEHDLLVSRRLFLENYLAKVQSGEVEPDSNTAEAFQKLADQYNNDTAKVNEKWNYGNPNIPPAARMVALKTLDVSSFESSIKSSKLNEKSESQLKGRKIAETISDAEWLKYANRYQGDRAKAFNIQFYDRKIISDGVDVGSEAGGEYMALLENSKAGPVEMMNISMEIIGDPYWLEDAFGQADKKGSVDDTMVDYSKETAVLFTSLAPAEPDPETGFLKAGSERADEFIQGIYVPYEVESTFNNGQFTQRVQMIRDPLTNIEDLKIRSENDYAEVKENARNK
tara:strand:- start:5122 stop:8004 length:2883 start_codon:yes stop_codon:yes gene_type:complete